MHGGIGDRLSALRDGACHVGVLPFDYFHPDEYALSASLIELRARGTLYFPNQGNIDENLDLIEKACKTDPFTGKKEQPAMAMVAPPRKPLVALSLNLWLMLPLRFLVCRRGNA